MAMTILQAALTLFADKMRILLTILTTDITTYEGGVIWKPDPEIYLLACQKTDTLPEYAYAIEDSYNGVLSAYRGGLRAIMVPDMLPPNEIMIESTEAIISSLTDVKEYLVKIG